MITSAIKFQWTFNAANRQILIINEKFKVQKRLFKKLQCLK
jgi:hypothetical protein